MMSEILGRAPRPGSSVFRCSDDGARWIASGALTFANAGPALEAASALPLPSSGVVDCAGISAADSAAVAVLLALLRHAEAAGTRLAFAAAPTVLTRLAELYDVEHILQT
jgi:phospholipid transport system transporter-binding protein